MSEKPKPSVSHIGYPPPAGGSPPTGFCVPGNSNRPSQIPLVDIEIEVPIREDRAAWFAEPPDVDGRPVYRGSAYSDDPAMWDGGGEPYDDDWRVRQTCIVDDPDFVDASQEAGLRKAAKAILDVKSEKQLLVEVGIATPWHAAPPDRPNAALTSRFAGMTKTVTFSSARRTTQFEGAANLQVFQVAWEVLGNRTVLEAGTASGWLAFEGIDISKAFSEARVLKKAARMIKDLEDFRSCVLTKPEDRIGGVPKGPIDACEVTIVNHQARRVVTVEQDDADKVRQITHGALRTFLHEELTIGPHADNPGANIAVPGRDGPAAQQAIDGPVLRSHANPDVPFQGPAVGFNGDRGRYGGQIVTDPALDGRPPREVVRRGGLAFRKREDGSASSFDGPPGLEWSPVGTDGAPTGPWTVFAGPSSLPNERAPLAMLAPGSLIGQVRDMAHTLALGLGRAVDAITKQPLAPGEVGNGYPDGAPADLASLARVPGSFEGLRLVPSSFGDPGGVVFEGPISDEGADAEALWRVKAPELFLLRVLGVTPGAGTNGGAYAWDVSGPGGTTPYLARSAIVHKQIHPADLSRDTRHVGDVGHALPASPFGFQGEGFLLNALGFGAISGAGATIALPPNTKGKVGIVVTLAEGPNLVPDLAGSTVAVQIDTAVRHSPWGPPIAGAVRFVPIADGAGTGTGVFAAPAGFVAPGQRTPTQMAVSVVYSPGMGTASPTSPLAVLGIGIEVAVVEGGYVLLTQEGIELGEAWRTNHAQPLERLAALDDWTIEVAKALTEGVAFTESWALELNPGVDEYDGLALDAAWSFEIEKIVADGVEIAESWTVALIP